MVMVVCGRGVDGVAFDANVNPSGAPFGCMFDPEAAGVEIEAPGGGMVAMEDGVKALPLFGSCAWTLLLLLVVRLGGSAELRIASLMICESEGDVA